MIYGFEDFELDTLKIELRKGGAPVALEPQVFALLCLLVENADRLVAKDEIIEKIWDGRIVSDSALASRVKSLRAALGDDGKAQRLIKTAHGLGFRFAGEPRALARPARLAPIAKETVKEAVAKPSIAVLPFRLIGVAGERAGVAEALPDELISVLARLRWLFVIARGTAFRFRPPDQDVVAVGAMLNVRYCLTGAVEIAGDKIVVAVELAETKSGGAIWGERFSSRIDDIHDVRERIITAIVAALELHIPLNEASAARLKSPDRLDAWSAYHLGLHHLYRFNKTDNAAALSYFEKAIGADSGFARAHAGLSSAHFQNAFLKYSPDRAEDVAFARAHAEKSVELDALDPFANFALGRAHWIDNNIIGGAGWLDRAVALCPNYAQGLYARAWANAITGEAVSADGDIDLALALSPLDPFRYAMLGVKGFSVMQKGDDAEAARWAEEAARAPGAHVLIAAIAVAFNALNGDRARAQYWAENVRARKPDLTQADFFEAFPFERPDLRARLSKALRAHGF